MADGFLATGVSYSEADKTAVVSPLIVENDGTPHPDITVKPVAGIKPAAGDIALVLTIRNNLDDKEVSRFFDASESNGRIVHIVTPVGGVFTFKGNYKFIGNMVFEGNVDVTGDVTIDGAVDVTGDVTIDGTVTISIDGEDIEIKTNVISGLPDVIQKSTGRTAFADNFMSAFGPLVSRIPGGLP